MIWPFLQIVNCITIHSKIRSPYNLCTLYCTKVRLSTDPEKVYSLLHNTYLTILYALYSLKMIWNIHPRAIKKLSCYIPRTSNLTAIHQFWEGCFGAYNFDSLLYPPSYYYFSLIFGLASIRAFHTKYIPLINTPSLFLIKSWNFDYTVINTHPSFTTNFFSL